MKETLLRIQTEMIYAAMVGAMKLPDPVLAGLLARFRKISIVLSNSEDEEVMMHLEELEEYFRDKSPFSEALRRIISEARPSQFKSIIRGYLINYVYDW